MNDTRLLQIRSLAAEAEKIAAELQDELTPHSYADIALGVVRESLARALVWIDKMETS